MEPDGSAFTQRAKRIRNAIALAVNPQTGSLWVGDAGQDDLPFGHPFEFLDDLSAHPGNADYGWPQCEENRHDYVPGYNCSNTVEPLVELPAYSTIIGAAFYPIRQGGHYAFPRPYRGGLFAAAHGSWHRDDHGCDAAPSRVVFIPMDGDRPAKSVDWRHPRCAMDRLCDGVSSRLHVAHRPPNRDCRWTSRLALCRRRRRGCNLSRTSQPWLKRWRSW